MARKENDRGFSIKEDLQGRPNDQAVEIVMISGPFAEELMQAAVDGRVVDLELQLIDLGLKYPSEAALNTIIKKYSRAILGRGK